MLPGDRLPPRCLARLPRLRPPACIAAPAAIPPLLAGVQSLSRRRQHLEPIRSAQGHGPLRARAAPHARRADGRPARLPACLLAAAVLAALGAAWWCIAPGRWALPGLPDDVDSEAARGGALARDLRAANTALVEKGRVADELIAGRLILSEAAEHFRRLDEVRARPPRRRGAAAHAHRGSRLGQRPRLGPGGPGATKGRVKVWRSGCRCWR